jgi:hypothetical protein
MARRFGSYGMAGEAWPSICFSGRHPGRELLSIVAGD